MPEEAATTPEAEAQETSTTAGTPGEETPATPATSEQETVDFEKRYNDLRPEFDRTTGQLKEAEPAIQLYQALQNPETRGDVLRYLQENLVEEDGAAGEPGDEEDQQVQDPRVDQLAQEFEQDRFERYLTDLESYIDSSVDDLAKDAGVKLTDDERNLIFATVEIQDDGSPKVEEAFKRISGLRDLHIKEYRDSKKDAPPPPAPQGGSGEPQAPTGDPKARLSRAMEVANRAFEAASS
jgi:hypothetical protein